MSEKISDVWKQKTEERKVKLVDKVFAGFPVKARRIPLRAMLKAGSLPQALVEHMLRLDNDSEYREQVAKNLTPEQYKRSIDYQRHVVVAVIAEPRFVFDDSPAGDGEVNYREFVQLCPEFVDEAVAWVEQGCPDVPVELEGGEETTVENLANFPDGERGGERAESGDNVESVGASGV